MFLVGSESTKNRVRPSRIALMNPLGALSLFLSPCHFADAALPCQTKKKRNHRQVEPKKMKACVTVFYRSLANQSAQQYNVRDATCFYGRTVFFFLYLFVKTERMTYVPVDGRKHKERGNRWK